MLSQKEYEVIIKSLQKGLSINQIITIFEKQKHITNIDMALNIITSSDKFKSSKLEVVQLKHPDDIPFPQELNPQGINKTLVIIDDCTIIKSINLTQLYVYGRPLNINTIHLSQKYTKVLCTIRENCNVFVLFKQTVKAIKDFIYKEIGDQFENDIEMKNIFHTNIKDKHDFVLYNKEEGKWYNKNLELINSGMGFKDLYKDEASYAEAKARAYKAEQENRKSNNDREHFTSALYESTSEVFKPLTNNQDKLLKEKQNIVKEISDLSNILKAMKEEPKEENKIKKEE